MMSPTTFHEDVFYEHFRPFRHDKSEFDIWGGLGLETYGYDLQLVRSYPTESVWSVLDGCSGPDQWIVPGIHFVNRVCFMLTEVSHDWADVQFRVHHNLASLTDRGLKRRLGMLRKILLVAQQSRKTDGQNQGADSKERLDAT